MRSPGTKQRGIRDKQRNASWDYAYCSADLEPQFKCACPGIFVS
jgi:hypothetical protein